MEINIGMKDAERRAVAEKLSRLLADTYTLYLKTHNYHWNVTGPMFQTLHLLFETQYTELATAVDAIAERRTHWANTHRAHTRSSRNFRRLRMPSGCLRPKT